MASFAGTVSQTEFDQAILRTVAGVEKKRSVLQGAEKESVAKHEVGHALVATAVAKIIPTSSQVEPTLVNAATAVACVVLILFCRRTVVAESLSHIMSCVLHAVYQFRS